MAEGLIVPDVCRFTVHGNYASRPVANVFDYFIAAAGGTGRVDAIEDLAARIVSSWSDDVLDNLADDYTATSVSWVDMDSEFGTVGSTSTGTGTDFPQSGAGAGLPMPGNVAIRVNKDITAQRGQRQGRTYLVGSLESYTLAADPNRLDPTITPLINADMASFLAATTVAPGGSPDYAAEMVVVHTHRLAPVPPATVGVLEVTGTSTVNSMTCEALLSSMRRRLRG